MTEQQITIGVILEGFFVPQWITAFLDQLLVLYPLMQIVLVRAEHVSDRSFRARSLRTLLLIDSWRTRRFRKRTDIRKSLVSPRVGIANSTAELNRAHVVLNLTETTTQNLQLKEPAWGVLSIRYGDANSSAVGCSGFWEVYRRAPISEAHLELACQGKQFSAGSIPVRTHTTSPFLNRCFLERAAMARLLFFVRKLFSAADPGQIVRQLPESNIPPNGELPGILTLLNSILRSAYRTAAWRLSSPARRPQWSFGVVDKPVQRFVRSDLTRVDWYSPQPDHFVADPFLFEQDQRKFVFVEEFDYRTRRGHISVTEYEKTSATEHFSALREVLRRDFHLSFPLVFKHEGRILMLPEQASTNTVVLYEATQFPLEWRECAVLLENFPGVDNVVFEHAGRWWLFTSYGGFGVQDCNLHLFSSESLFGPFVPHPMNPVVVGLRGARMAGNILQDGSTILRLGQNCVRRYGGSVVIHRVTKLSMTDYQEEEVEEILPPEKGEFCESFHTLNSSGELSVVTGMRFI